MDKESIQPILDELKAALSDLYGERLRGVYLYGSYARGTATDESDIDVLVVLDGEICPRREIFNMGQIVSDLCLEHDVLISTVPISAQEYQTKQTPFISNVSRDAVAL